MIKMELSVICVYNNHDIFERLLLPTVSRQREADFELICVDNSNNKSFDSLSKAYNTIYNTASGRLLLFVHQDVELLSDYVLRDLLRFFDILNSETSVGGLGVLGANLKTVFPGIARNVRVASRLYSEDNHRLSSSIPVSSPVAVSTLDECFFALSSDALKANNFAENEGLEWDFYVTYLSFLLERRGFKNFVLPLYVNHSPTFKYLVNSSDLYSIEGKTYGTYVVNRFLDLYANSALYEELSGLYDNDSNEPCIVPWCSSRYPLNTLRLRSWRRLIRSIGMFSFIRKILAALIASRARRILSSENPYW